MKKKTHLANASLGCGVFSWVPLINMALAPLSILFGIMSLYKITKDPKHYEGTVRTFIGLALGVMWMIFSIIAFYNEGPSLFIR